MTKILFYIIIISSSLISNCFGQNVTFSIHNKESSFKMLKLKDIVIGEKVYTVPPDSNKITLKTSLPTKFVIRFEKGFIEGNILSTKSYCKDDSIQLILHKLKRKRYTYYQRNCSDRSYISPVLKLHKF